MRTWGRKQPKGVGWHEERLSSHHQMEDLHLEGWRFGYGDGRVGTMVATRINSFRGEKIEQQQEFANRK
jgi:hypothetical protein